MSAMPTIHKGGPSTAVPSGDAASSVNNTTSGNNSSDKGAVVASKSSNDQSNKDGDATAPKETDLVARGKKLLLAEAKEQAQEDPDGLDAEEATANAERMKLMLESFSDAQLQRYECYRRSTLQKSLVKKIMQQVSPFPITPSIPIVMGGVAKILVGELVENALAVQKEMGESGPLRQHAVRESLRRITRHQPFPQAHSRRRRFRR